MLFAVCCLLFAVRGLMLRCLLFVVDRWLMRLLLRVVICCLSLFVVVCHCASLQVVV